MRPRALYKRRFLLPVLFFCLTAYLLLTLRGLAPPPPGMGRFSLLVVQSGSMAPVFATHSVIVVDKQVALPLNTGEVVTYHSADGRLITHRIVAAGFDGQAYYITKGDANRSADLLPLREPDIFGRVVYVTPSFFAFIVRFLRTPAALFSLFGLLLVLLICRLPTSAAK